MGEHDAKRIDGARFSGRQVVPGDDEQRSNGTPVTLECHGEAAQADDDGRCGPLDRTYRRELQKVRSVIVAPSLVRNASPTSSR
ncbi:hypothetical protein [Pseudonocardia alaniniphila]